jgi:Mn2+/Fe2+ NRAMP family transporter
VFIYQGQGHAASVVNQYQYRELANKISQKEDVSSKLSSSWAWTVYISFLLAAGLLQVVICRIWKLRMFGQSKRWLIRLRNSV